MKRMPPAQTGLEDPRRLATLDATGLLSIPRVVAFDRLVHAAARAVHAPVTQINLITADRQIARACFGPEEWMHRGPVTLEYSYCQHVVSSGEALAVADARVHPLTRDNLATLDSGIISYAAVPLITSEGYALGTLCAVDFQVREWTSDEMDVLRGLADVAVLEIEERLRIAGEADRALQESQARYRLLTEVDPGGIVVMDDAGVIVSANPAMERIFGYTAEELVGRPLTILIPERLRAAHEKGIRRYLATGRRNIPWSGVELPGLTKSGREVPTEISFGEYLEDGRHVFAGFIHDISHRKREEARRAAEHAVTRVLADSPDLESAAREILPAIGRALQWDFGALWELDPEREVLRCAEIWVPEGAGAERFVRATREATFARGEGLPGRTWERGAPVWVTDAAREPGMPRAYLAAEEGLHGAFAFPITVAGEVRGVIEFFAHSREEPDESLLRTLEAVGSEIGQYVQRLRAERARDGALAEALEARQEAEAQAEELQVQAAQLEETQAELEMTNEDLQTVNAELELRTEEAERSRAAAEIASQAKSQFLAMMSHEIRTPINAVIGYAELMEMQLAGPLTEEQRSYLERVRRASQHLLALVGDVLDLARVEAGQMTVDEARAPLRETIRDAIQLVLPQATEAGVAVQLDSCTDSLYHGDPARVGQILINLLSNAVKFTEAGGRVAVACAHTDRGPTEQAGPWVRVDVADSGIGIPPEYQEQIFQPFYQLQGGYTRESGGTGLGLAISRRLARLMGGDVTVQSRPGEGSRFTLWLPAAPRA